MKTLRVFLRHILTALLIILPPAAVLRIILSYGRDVPWMDQWSIPGKILVSHLRGTLALSDFFQAHNESVKAFSGLIWFLLARSGWNPRMEMVVAWLLMVLLAILLYLLLRTTLNCTSIVRRVIFILMVLILFHPYGVDHWLTGLCLENALVIFFLSAGLLVNRLSMPVWLNYLLATCFSLAATFSYANGMVLWILIWPALPLLFSRSGIAGLRSRHRVFSLFYLAAGLSSIIGYFAILASSPHKVSQTSLSLDTPLATVTFLLHWLGAPFSLHGVVWSVPWCGTAILILFLVPLISFIRRQRRGEDVQAYYPWLLLASYTLITGVVIAVGRQNIGLETALAPRYFMHSVLLPTAILPLTFLVRRNSLIAGGRGRFLRGLYLFFSGLMALYCTISIICRWPTAEVRAGRSALSRDRGAVALSFIKVIPRNRELLNIRGSVSPPNAQVRIMVRHGILDLPLHQPPPIGSDRPTEQRIEGLHLKLRYQGAIHLTGRCPKRHAGGEISHLLLTSIHGDRPEKAFAVITPELSLHPRQARRNAGEYIRFRTRVSTLHLEQGLHLVQAWVFDASSGEYTPLVHQWKIQLEANHR